MQVTAEAAATPPNSPSGTSTSRNTLQLYVEGCPATAMSVNTVQVSLSPPVGRSIPSVLWAANTQAEALTTLKFTDSQVMKFNATWTRTDAMDSRMAGSVLVTNPTAAAVTIKSAAVQVSFADNKAAAAPGAAAPAAAADTWSSIDVQCKETTLAPGASVNCSYSGTIPGRRGSSCRYLGQAVLHVEGLQ